MVIGRGDELGANGDLARQLFRFLGDMRLERVEFLLGWPASAVEVKDGVAVLHV